MNGVGLQRVAPIQGLSWREAGSSRRRNAEWGLSLKRLRVPTPDAPAFVCRWCDSDGL